MKKGNKDLTDQPLTSSIWGKRIKDKWHKELKWLIQENLCEILVTLNALIMFVFIYLVLTK